MATMIMLSHHAFRRDLARFQAALTSFEPAREAALREEWATYHASLHGHHVQEDSAIFPSTKVEHPALAAALDHLSDQHHRIDPLLARADAAFAKLPHTMDAAVVLEELQRLLDSHLDMEEAVLIPTIREAKQFPAPADAAMAAMYADGFAWAMDGIAPAVLEKVREMLPAILVERLPDAVERFEGRKQRVWGHPAPMQSTTSCPAG